MPTVDHAASYYCSCGVAWETSFRGEGGLALEQIMNTLERVWRNTHDGDRCRGISRDEYRKMMREKSRESITR